MGSGSQTTGRLIALVLGCFVAPQAYAACAPDTLELRGASGTVRLRIELADTAAERAKGLMFRESMPNSAGMLFVYDHPQSVAFWMKNTLIPLDMIFADESGTVTHVHENAVPRDETAIPGGDKVQFVLEINGGLAKRLGISEGAALRHATIAANKAVWPCE